MLKRVVFSAPHPKNSSTGMQVKSQAQRTQVQTLRGALLQHDNVSGGGGDTHSRVTLVIQQNPEAKSLVCYTAKH